MRYLDQSTEVALVESTTSYMIVFRGSEQATDVSSATMPYCHTTLG